MSIKTMDFTTYKIITGEPLIIIKPIINIGRNDNILSIDFSYFDKNDAIVLNPEIEISEIEVQIESKPDSDYPVIDGKNQNRIYDSEPILPTNNNHILTKNDININTVMAFYIQYKDLNGKLSVIAYRPKF